jgi:hypothetical protein
MLIVAVLVGCNSEPSAEIKARSAELSSGFGKQIVAIDSKQDHTISMLTEVKSRVGDLLLRSDDTTKRLESLEAKLIVPTVNRKEVIQSSRSGKPGNDTDSATADSAALEPQETAQANPSQSHQPVALSPAVRLYVSSSENCAPCAQLWRDVDAGEFDGFEVLKADDFDGLRSYPAIRFEYMAASTGWAVRYGYDREQLKWLRKNLLGKKSQAVAVTGVSHGDLVAIHNQLHGGGNWTWPGDLETHLRETHGYGIKSHPVTLINRGTSCPNGRCPTPRRGLFGMFR